MANALGKRLGVTAAQIKKIKSLETYYTRQAMNAMVAGNTEEFKRLIAERDCQTSWLRAYAY